jgi:uncharacterized Ntn-hydrolase superfamily protein
VSPRRRVALWLRRGALATLCCACALAVFPSSASATWSILAVDAHTGRVVIASATCVSQESIARFPARSLMDIQAVIVPGVGVAAAQATLDRTRFDQSTIFREIKRGTPPDQILALLRAKDPDFETRQFGIVDRRGRTAAYSGEADGRYAASVGGRVPGTDVYYSIQGNILASPDVVTRAARALGAAQGTLEDRVMAGMEAADAAGGDRRCSCRTDPVLMAPCRTRHAQVAYLLASDPKDRPGASFNDGRYRLYIDVNDENIRPDEDANPVVTLRMRYDAWKAGGTTD